MIGRPDENAVWCRAKLSAANARSASTDVSGMNNRDTDTLVLGSVLVYHR